MASYYVYHGGADTDGASWANAYVTLVSALAKSPAKAAGDVFYIAHDHTDAASGAVTISMPGYAALPNKVICVNRGGSVPPVSADVTTGAVVQSGVGDYAVTIGSGSGDNSACYWQGVTFKSGTGAVTAAVNCVGLGRNRFDNCTFWKPGTTANGAAIYISSGSGSNYAARHLLNNCTIRLGATGDSICLGSTTMRGGSVDMTSGSAIVPTTLLKAAGAGALLEGVDLSGGACGIDVTGAQDHTYRLLGCKLHASSAVGTTTAHDGQILELIGCASDGKTCRAHRVTFRGYHGMEYTVVRTPGATDGTTPHAWKFNGTANTSWTHPCESLPLAIWNDITGQSVTVTVYGTYNGNGGVLPTKDQVWIEVEYMATAGSTLMTIDKSNTKANDLATATDQTTDTSDWGFQTDPQDFKMQVTITPGQKGPIYVRVFSSTNARAWVIDPKIYLS